VIDRLASTIASLVIVFRPRVGFTGSSQPTTTALFLPVVAPPSTPQLLSADHTFLQAQHTQVQLLFSQEANQP